MIHLVGLIFLDKKKSNWWSCLGKLKSTNSFRNAEIFSFLSGFALIEAYYYSKLSQASKLQIDQPSN